MSLTIHSEEDQQRQLLVHVEVPEERVEKEMRRAAREIGQEVSIPGFRRGKVPYPVLVQRIGRNTLRAEAVEDMLIPVLEETLRELDLEPYSQPILDDMEIEPFVVDFIIPMKPVVNLGDYREIRMDVPSPDVTDDAVDEALEEIRISHQIIEPVDRPIMTGDLVRMSITGEIYEEDSTELFMDEERIQLVMDPDETFAGTGFVDNIIGLEIGDDGEFTVTFPEDYDDETVAGREVTFTITVLDVMSRYVPPLDDELAREEGDFGTLEELRETVREELESGAEDRARGELLDQFVDAVVDRADLVYPPAAVDDELDRMVEDLKERVSGSGWQWEDYLKLQGETEETLRDEWLETAEDQVQRGLIIREFIQSELLRTDDTEVADAISRRLDELEDEDEAIREQLGEYLASGAGRGLLASQLMIDKVHDRIVAIVSGNAPDLADLEAEEEE